MCIENANINIQSKCHVPTVTFLRVAPKTKIDFLENRFRVDIPSFFLNFSFVFLGAFENYWEIFTFDQSTNEIHFPIRKDTVEENLSIFIVLKGNDRYKNKKMNEINKKKHRSL